MITPWGLFARGWPFTSWLVTFVACSGGFVNTMYAYGWGYALSLMANSTISAIMAMVQSERRWPNGFALAGCSLYMVYGLRLAVVLWQRRSDRVFARNLKSAQRKTNEMAVRERLVVVLSASLSQALYVLPLRIATLLPPPDFDKTRGILALGGIVLAAGGFLIEAVADKQRLAAKRIRPHEPVTSGLYRLFHRPNYFGQMLFHLGVCGLAANARNTAEMCCSLISPLFMFLVTAEKTAEIDTTTPQSSY